MPARAPSGAVPSQRDEAMRGARSASLQCLENLLGRAPALRFASLSTTDGRPFATAISHSNVDAHRVAAMTSSLLALSESFSREALRSNCTHSTISTQHGVIVTVRVPSARRMFVLSIGSDSSEMMAMVLRQALDTAEKIAGILDCSAS